jgi:hypothetical protein
MSRRGHFLEAVLDGGDGAMIAIEGRDQTLATSVECAFDSAARNRGLLGRDSLPDAAAIVIAPCSAVHTFGMRFAIDVIHAAHDGRVIRIRRAVAPSRISAAFGAFATIEMAAGSSERAALKAGDRLIVTKPARPDI